MLINFKTLLGSKSVVVVAAIMAAGVVAGGAGPSLAQATRPAPATLPAADAKARALRVYHVGNSVTDTFGYESLRALAKGRGRTYEFGRHVMPGTPLFGLWDNQDKGFTQPPYGVSKTALANFEWDVLTLQTYDRLLEGGWEADFETSVRFIDHAIRRSPRLQVYVYSRWPKRKEVAGSKPTAYEPLDFERLWTRPYTGHWDTTYETHDYFQKLIAKLNGKYGDALAHPVAIVPVGEVMAELNKRIVAGSVPDLKRIDDLYVDSVHLTDAGRYLVGLTFYATLFKDDPRGLPTKGYGKVSPTLAEAIGQCVADVVAKQSKH